jgi:hypothetical protein
MFKNYFGRVWMLVVGAVGAVAMMVIQNLLETGELGFSSLDAEGLGWAVLAGAAMGLFLAFFPGLFGDPKS